MTETEPRARPGKRSWHMRMVRVRAAFPGFDRRRRLQAIQTQKESQLVCLGGKALPACGIVSKP